MRKLIIKQFLDLHTKCLTSKKVMKTWWLGYKKMKNNTLLYNIVKNMQLILNRVGTTYKFKKSFAKFMMCHSKTGDCSRVGYHLQTCSCNCSQPF